MVVSGDLSKAVAADTVVAGLRTLQQLLDDWPSTQPKVAQIYGQLNKSVDAGQPAPFATFNFQASDCAAPLPRAYQWADGSAYVNHVELVRRARGAEMPASFWTEPLMYQGGSDAFLGPRDPIAVADEAWGIDLEGGGRRHHRRRAHGGDAADEARSACALLMLVNDVSLRNLIPAELAKGFGFFHGKPSTAFSPVAVTPDELGDAWRDGKVHLPLLAAINGKPLGRPNAGVDMTFSFPQLIAHAAKTRRAGRRHASSAPARSRTRTAMAGRAGRSSRAAPATPASPRCARWRRSSRASRGRRSCKFGDRVRIEMLDEAGRSIFGAIEQEVVKYVQ